MIYVRMNKQRPWHIPKFGIAGADALCGAESPGLFRGWDQTRKSLLARQGLCLRCAVSYEKWKASDPSWPVPYTCDFCGAQEDMARCECSCCGRMACGECASDFRWELLDGYGHTESCKECYSVEVEDRESIESGE